jgi:hypothetical protein
LHCLHLHEARATLFADLVRQRTVEFVGGGALDRRVGEAADAVELRLAQEVEQSSNCASVSPGKPAMKVLRSVMSGHGCARRGRARCCSRRWPAASCA